MLNKRILGTATAISLLLLGGTALADPQFTDQTNPADVQGIDVTAISLNHAIASVEQNTGGKVMEIRFDGSSGRGMYDAVVVQPGVISNASVDAQTGKVTALGNNETPDWMLDWKHRAELKSWPKANVSLAGAIATVEQASGARAVNAYLAEPLTTTNRVLAYNVEVMKNGQPMGVAIDANTREVIANPEAFGTMGNSSLQLSDPEPGRVLRYASSF